jgi:hypothetical protein
MAASRTVCLRRRDRACLVDGARQVTDRTVHLISDWRRTAVCGDQGCAGENNARHQDQQRTKGPQFAKYSIHGHTIPADRAFHFDPHQFRWRAARSNQKNISTAKNIRPKDSAQASRMTVNHHRLAEPEPRTAALAGSRGCDDHLARPQRRPGHGHCCEEPLAPDAPEVTFRILCESEIVVPTQRSAATRRQPEAYRGEDGRLAKHDNTMSWVAKPAANLFLDFYCWTERLQLGPTAI